MELTIFRDHVFKDGVSAALGDWRQIQLAVVFDHEALHPGSVLQLQECSHAPHDGKDEELLQVWGWQGVMVVLILLWDQSF